MPPLDLNAPLFPFLPGTGFEQIGGFLGSLALWPLVLSVGGITTMGSTGIISDSVMQAAY